MFLFYVLTFSKKGDIIQGGTLFKGGHYLRKYGMCQEKAQYWLELQCQKSLGTPFKKVPEQGKSHKGQSIINYVTIFKGVRGGNRVKIWKLMTLRTLSSIMGIPAYYFQEEILSYPLIFIKYWKILPIPINAGRVGFPSSPFIQAFPFVRDKKVKSQLPSSYQFVKINPVLNWPIRKQYFEILIDFETLTWWAKKLTFKVGFSLVKKVVTWGREDSKLKENWWRHIWMSTNIKAF